MKSILLFNILIILLPGSITVQANTLDEAIHDNTR